MWSPKPGETRRPARPSTTYTVEDDLRNASDSDERDEPRDYSWGRRSQGPRYHAPQEDDKQPWTRRDLRGGHPRYAEFRRVFQNPEAAKTDTADSTPMDETEEDGGL